MTRTTTTQINDLNYPSLTRYQINGDVYDQMRATLRILGAAMLEGSHYLPIRNRAAALATLAAPKDYFGQVAHIYKDFLKRWRYVKDPLDRELIARAPKQIFELTMGGRSGSPGVGLGLGAGDCDDAAVAMGAQLLSIGIPVRIACTAPLGAPPGRLMSHVFVQGMIPGFGWVTVDPVVWPDHGLGFTPKYSRIAFFNLAGDLIGKNGNTVALSGMIEKEKKNMETFPHNKQFPDLAGFGDYSPSGNMIPDFRAVGIAGFGAYAEDQGIIDASELPMGLGVEVETDQNGLAWAPAIEIAPRDLRFVRAAGAPYHGMLGLTDTGDAVYWDQNLGFFKKLFRRIKKGVKRIGKGIKNIAKKVISKIPGGKYLLKLGQKVWAISKKLVSPIMKVLAKIPGIKMLGPLALKIAPIAAFLPGFGPAIAAGLAMSGKVLAIMNKYGVKLKSAEGKVAKLKFPDDKVAKKFQDEIKHHAKKEQKRQAAGGKIEASKQKRKKGFARPARPMVARASRSLAARAASARPMAARVARRIPAIMQAARSARPVR